MTFLVLDVDRGGDGHWTNELQRRYRTDRPALRDAFSAPCWSDFVVGRRPIEPVLADALDAAGAAASAAPPARRSGSPMNGPVDVEAARANGWSAVHVGDGRDWIGDVEALVGLGGGA